MLVILAWPIMLEMTGGWESRELFARQLDRSSRSKKVETSAFGERFIAMEATAMCGEFSEAMKVELSNRRFFKVTCVSEEDGFEESLSVWSYVWPRLTGP